VGLPETVERLRQAPPRPSPWMLPAGLALVAVVAISAVALIMGTGVRPPFYEDSPMPTPKHKAPFRGATGFKILVDAKVVVSVKNLEESIQKVEEIAKSFDGRIESSRTTGSGEPHQQTMLVSVPSAKLQEAVDKFKALGVLDKAMSKKGSIAVSKEAEEIPPAERTVSVVLRLVPPR
jgi:hypothetical protein